MSLDLSPQFPIDRSPLIPLRLIVGYGFMEHGFAKLAKGPDAFANILQAMGVPGPHFMAWATILVRVGTKQNLANAANFELDNAQPREQWLRLNGVVRRRVGKASSVIHYAKPQRPLN